MIKHARKIVHKLRQHPEQDRKHIVHIITFIGAVIVILLWTFSLGKSFGAKETEVKIKQDLEPFSVFKDNIVDGYKSISADEADMQVDVIE